MSDDVQIQTNPMKRYPLAIDLTPEADHCPACKAPLRGRLFVCERCWWKTPTKHRVEIRSMWIRKQDTTSKLAKIVRHLVARGAGE